MPSLNRCGVFAVTVTRPLLFLVVAATLHAPGVQAFGEAPKFLIVTAASTGKVAYLKLPDYGGPAPGGESFKTLIDKGLTFPQGVAIDEYRKKLYVADPNIGKLVRYDLYNHGDSLSVGKQQVIAEDVEVRAVAVDGLGNVFFTEEPSQRIMRVTAKMIEDGVTEAQTIYSANATSTVSSPGGVALDNYFVYWLNKDSGTQAGTLIRAHQEPLNPSREDESTKTMATNAIKCYGICLALNNVFYTDENSNLYGIPRASTARSNPVTITSALQQPRGCAYDGGGTVYIADKAANAVYQFASNMSPLHPHVTLMKAGDLQGAFGVAIYTHLTN